MIDTIDRNICTGCKMCADICPLNAISFKEDTEGFWFPKVDAATCIKCGICRSKCPSLNATDNSIEFEIRAFGVKSNNEEIRWNSTSGGFFSETANIWIDEGGLCVGASYSKYNTVFHEIAENKEGIERLRRSKYFQSDTAGIYLTIKRELSKGRRVMFCGSPCQVEALNAFMGKTYDGLVTIDFVCCGISSPLVFRKYCEELSQKYGAPIREVWFKNKTDGWKAIGTKIEFENGKSYFKNGAQDLYMVAFVGDAFNIRRSCFNCAYRKLPHHSDLTIADFWGIENVNPHFDDNRGTSAVLVNTEKGMKLFERIIPSIEYFETTVDDVARGNFTIYHSKEENPNRDAFYSELNKSSFYKAMRKFSSYRGLHKMKIDTVLFLSKLKHKIWR